jgi:hypothetical protein
MKMRTWLIEAYTNTLTLFLVREGDMNGPGFSCGRAGRTPLRTLLSNKEKLGCGLTTAS